MQEFAGLKVLLTLIERQGISTSGTTVADESIYVTRISFPNGPGDASYINATNVTASCTEDLNEFKGLMLEASILNGSEVDPSENGNPRRASKILIVVLSGANNFSLVLFGLPMCYELQITCAHAIHTYIYVHIYIHTHTLTHASEII